MNTDFLYMPFANDALLLTLAWLGLALVVAIFVAGVVTVGRRLFR